MGVLSNQACADAIAALTYDQVGDSNTDTTACLAVIPKGTAGSGLNETDYSELIDNLDNKSTTDLNTVKSILSTGSSDFILALGDDVFEC